MRLGRTAGMIAALGAVWLASQTAQAEEAGERLRYRIAYGNVPLAEASVLLQERNGRYEVSGEGVTSGPLDWLFDWRGRASTVGRLSGTVFQPELHAQHGTWRGEQRLAEVRYEADRPIVHNVVPPPDPEETTQVPEESIPGTIDPFSAALTALKQFAATGTCRGTLPIFDGRRRYDMLLEDAGQTVLQSDRPWDYSGHAYGCKLKSRRIGGFFRDPDVRLTEDGEDSERVVWLAELAPGVWRPVRIEIDAPLGKIVARAVLAAE